MIAAAFFFLVLGLVLMCSHNPFRQGGSVLAEAAFVCWIAALLLAVFS